MRCKSAFGHVVHTFCAYLDLQRTAFLVLYCYVQGFVSVRLRIGDPVAQTFCVRVIFFRDIGEYLPAECVFDVPVLFAVDDEPDCEYVEDALERHILLLHLLVDGQCCLGADLQFVFDAFVTEFLLQRFDELGHELLPVALCALELVGDGPVLLRLSISEIDVLHLALDVV